MTHAPTATRPHDEAHDTAKVVRDFKAAVNMSALALEKWLETDDSKWVGWTHEGARESVGHQSGCHILRLLRQSLKADDLRDIDVDHMRKVTGYVHRHLAQEPDGDIEHSNWRYSLMNWGHDPMRKGR
jgi:hypothetical protein